MSKRMIPLILCIPAVFMTGTASARIFLVTPQGTGDFPTIQAAFEGVADGDTVELADGAFQGWGNYNIDCLGREVLLRSQSGDPAACVIDAQMAGRCFLIENYEGPELVIEGITISNGYANVSGGGAFLRHEVAPTFRNCVFAHNTAVSDGAGLYCVAGCAPTIIDCVFRGNASLNQQGGGMLCSGYPSATLLRCQFIENSAWSGGGLVCYGDNFAEITECIFEGNTAEVFGGGFKATSTQDGNVVLTDCVFIGNHCDEWGGGVEGGKATYIGCEFYGNTAGNEGGAAFLSGDQSGEEFIGCTFAENYAPWCGGVRYWESFGRIANCTFYANATDLESAAVYATDGGLVVVENTVISFSEGGCAVVVGNGSSMELSCCDIYGNEGGDWVGYIAGQYGVAGNISADPLFCDVPAGDFGLQEGSPCGPFSPPNPECDLIGAWPVGCVASVPDRSTGASGPAWTSIAPNPTRSQTRLVFSTAGEDPIVVAVYDAAGRSVRRLAIGSMPGGVHEIVWDGRDGVGRLVPAGVYLAKLKQGSQQSSRAIIVSR